jgi:hypothetical protein
MRHSIFCSLALFAILLVGCTPDTTPLHPTSELDFRSSEDCQSYEDLQMTSSTCEDFSSCADLVGKRPFSITFGDPPTAITGQPNEPDVTELGLCGNPLASHPFSFSFSERVDNPAEVYVSRYLGRVQSVEYAICVRPYLDPETTGPIPFPITGLYDPAAGDFPYELYSACNDMVGSYTIVAANGDELSLAFEADGFPDCDNPDLYALVGQWTVTGGTGRFADATGGGCMTGSGWANPFALNPGASDIWTLEGGIDF